MLSQCKVNLLCFGQLIMQQTGTDAAKCAYVLCLMGIFWVFEFIPLAVTSLFPVALFPLLGLMSTAEVSSQYFNNTIVLMLGSKKYLRTVFLCT
jgi:sodium-dependent dicarboxylate transporter 2/3/5